MYNQAPNQGQVSQFTEADNYFFQQAINRSPWLNSNPQLAMITMATVRDMSYNASNTSAVHQTVFQAFANNNFQNQAWQQWCQLAVDFLELLITQRGYQPNAAINKAAKCTVEAALGATFCSNQQYQQSTPQQMWNGMQQAAQMYQQMQADIRNMRSGGFAQQQQQYGGGNQLPPINMGQHQQYHGQPQYQQQQSAQVSGYSATSHYNPQPAYNTATGTSGNVESSLYDVTPAPVQPLQPKEEISTDYYGAPIHQEPAPMQTYNQAPIAESTNLPIPTKVTEVVVDPTYYQPQGFKLDINRAYDLIHNPGGIEIRPAQLSDWEVTPGDDAPWPQLIDPNSFCLFYVRFPDGTVKEKFVEWTNSMDYLRHELDTELRRKAYRPNGIVVSSATPISTIGGDAITAEEVVSLVQDGHLKRSEVPPIVLPMVFQGSTDLEIEGQVREELSNLLDTNFKDDIPMPAVEYRSQFTHTLPLSGEAYNALIELADTKENALGQVAQGLRDLTKQGVISIRVFRALNDRLTKAVNGVMADTMGLTIQIDDFCEDYLELEDYLQKNRGEAMRKVLQGAARSVLNRAMTIIGTDTGSEEEGLVYHVVDNYINFQLGWDLADLAALNIKQGKPVVVSELAHPVILGTLRGIISRANESSDKFIGVMRLITRDGYYLEVMKGRLVANATLLKLIR